MVTITRYFSSYGALVRVFGSDLSVFIGFTLEEYESLLDSGELGSHIYKLFLEELKLVLQEFVV